MRRYSWVTQIGVWFINDARIPHPAMLSPQLSSAARHASSKIKLSGGNEAVGAAPKSMPTLAIQALATWISVWFTEVTSLESGLHLQNKSIFRWWWCWYQWRQCCWRWYSALAAAGSRLKIESGTPLELLPFFLSPLLSLLMLYIGGTIITTDEHHGRRFVDASCLRVAK